MYPTLSKLFPLFLLLGLCLAACSTPALIEAKSDQARILEPQVPADILEALVGGNNAFALDLYQSLRTSDGNLFYSPYSISLALAMTYGGARGETEAQMADVLHFDLAQADQHPAFNQLDLDLLQLNIANAVWAQQDHPFLPAYLDLLALNYGAGIHLADFTTQAEPTRREINAWISDQTQERIQDILSPGDLDALTRMVLVNAIYFKADWQTQFDPNDTHEAPFYLLDGSQVQVDLMSNDLQLPYLRGENYQAVELPYAGGDAVMDILLPDEGQFAAFEAGLGGPELDAILSSLQDTQLHLEMPKFTFRRQFALAEQLAGLGMTDAFDPSVADFSGMDGMRDLFISDVIHQAFVAVDEEGTEAAAATVVIMKLTGLPFPGIQLTIDRPFIFLIRDLSSGQILFFGRVLNPGQ
ncbi:MAG: serpin family protein [Anaerolineales bacterium]|nr:serpin family protein [Anaerolineales bacterium]